MFATSIFAYCGVSVSNDIYKHIINLSLSVCCFKRKIKERGMCNRARHDSESYTSHVMAKLKSSSAKIRVPQKLGFTIIEEITGLVGHVVAIWLPKCHNIILVCIVV